MCCLFRTWWQCFIEITTLGILLCRFDVTQPKRCLFRSWCLVAASRCGSLSSIKRSTGPQWSSDQEQLCTFMLWDVIVVDEARRSLTGIFLTYLYSSLCLAQFALWLICMIRLNWNPYRCVFLALCVRWIQSRKVLDAPLVLALATEAAPAFVARHLSVKMISPSMFVPYGYPADMKKSPLIRVAYIPENR